MHDGRAKLVVVRRTKEQKAHKKGRRTLRCGPKKASGVEATDSSGNGEQRCIHSTEYKDDGSWYRCEYKNGGRSKAARERSPMKSHEMHGISEMAKTGVFVLDTCTADGKDERQREL